MTDRSVQTTGRYRDIVEKTEAVVLAKADEAIRIPAVCRAVAVSERTLRKAFKEIYGQSPCRRFRMLRLDRARQTLLSLQHEPTKVTEVATGLGFLELGRFSVEYRKAFGESPSQTLRSANRCDSQPVDMVSQQQDTAERDNNMYCWT